jgi:O-antigen ligase
MRIIKNIFCYLLVTLSALSYHPMVTENEALVNKVRIVLYILAAISLLLSFKISYFRKHRILIVWVGVLLFLVVQSLIVSSIGVSDKFFGDLLSIAFTLAAVLIGCSLELSEKQLFGLIISYGLCLAIAGISQIFYNFGGFVIQWQYADFAKNSFGPMIGVFVISSTFIYSRCKGVSKIILLTLVLLNVAVLVTIRARAAILATAFVLIFFFLFVLFNDRNKSSKLLFRIASLFLAIIISVLLFSDFFSNALDYLYDSIFISTEYGVDITSGRTERNVIAWETFGQSPLFGLLGTSEEIPWIHNYPLLILAEYGLIGGLILLFFYIYLLVFLLKAAFRGGVLKKYDAGFWCVGFLFIISMAEPTFPYLPGTAIVFAYILLGRSITKMPSLNNSKRIDLN